MSVNKLLTFAFVLTGFASSWLLTWFYRPARVDAGPGVGLRIVATGFIKGQLEPRVRSYSLNRTRHLGGVAYLAGMVRSHLSEAPGPSPAVLLDLGDHLSGSALCERTRGAIMVDALNQLPYDASLVSNFEFSYGQDILALRAGEARYPYITSNYTFEHPGLKERLKPWVILDRGGLRIAIMGLSPERLKEITQRELVEGVEVAGDEEVLARAKTLKSEGRADLVVLLTKVPMDAPPPELVKRIEESDVDLVLGVNYERDGSQVLKWGRALATGLPGANRGSRVKVIDLVIDPARRSISSHEAFVTAVSVEEGPGPDVAVARKVGSAMAAHPDLAEVVGTLRGPLPHRWKGESLMANLVTDALRAVAGTDIALINSGAIQDGLETGEVTMGELHESLPWPNQAVRFRLTGSQLRQILETGIPQEFIYHPSGFAYVARQGAGGNVEKLEITVGGEPLDPERTFTAVTSDFAFKRIAPLRQTRFESVGLIRDAVMAHLRARSPIAMDREKRDLFEIPGGDVASPPLVTPGGRD